MPNPPKKRRAWPQKRREAQAARCKAAKPSRHSTGPKTRAGKETACRNATKHGLRSAEVTALRALLRVQAARLKSLAQSKIPPP